jgi:dTDP-4-amino-4,6-dideoxygalactose transaminase
VSAGETHGWQSYVALHAGERDALMEALEARGIATRVGTLAVHRTALYGLPAEACPAATAAEERSIALPLYPGLTDAEQDQVIEALHAYQPRRT